METWQHISEPAQRVLKSVVRRRLAEHIHSIPSTKIPIKAIWRISAKDRDAVARKLTTVCHEQENPNGKTY